MSRFIPRNLGPRIFFYTMAAYAAIVILAATIYVTETYRSERESILRELRIYQNSFNQPLASLLWSMDQVRINDLLHGISLIPSVVGIRLDDPDRNTLLAEVGQVPSRDGDGDLREVDSLFGQRSDIVYREHGQNVTLGRLTLYSATTAIYERIRYRVVLVIGGAVIQVLFLWLVLHSLIKHLISRRLAILTTAVETFDPNRPGENAAPIDISGQDELSILGCAFEEQRARLITVLDSLNNSQARLAELNRELEAKVEERTAELAAAKEFAEHASRAKSEFLATMSHEMRTPLNAVLGMAYLALQQDIPPAQRHYLDSIQLAAHSLLGVISDTLDLSKIEAGKLELDRIDFDLDRVLEGVAVVVGHQAREQQLDFRVQVARDVPHRFIGDPQRLGQILQNLAGNAAKFTESGGVCIDIAVMERNGGRICLRFSVADTGIGLSEAQIGVIFDAFTQVDGSATRRFGGTGLGLSICSSLVKMMGGAIEVESQPGEGSTFSFTAWFDASTETAAGSEQGMPLDGLRLLLSGAEFAALLPLSAMLERAGAHVLSIDDAARVLNGGHFPFDLLVHLLDNGGDAWVRLQEHLPPDSRVLLIGDGLPECTDTRGIDCFSGPIAPLGLAKAVSQALGCDTADDQKGATVPIVGRHVLLVEDNPINQQVGRGLLEQRGVTVTVAADGAEALQTLKEQQFDLVLMDIEMPGMSGYEATRALRRIPGLQALPVVAMTAHATEEARQACIEAGMDGFLTKPIEPERLYQALEQTQRLPEHAPSAKQGLEQAAAAFGELPGIDVRCGLRHTGGDARLYGKLLRDFRHYHADDGETLRGLVAQQRYEDARKLVHTLKGIAGSLGAAELQGLCRNVEEGLPRHLDERQLQLLIAAQQRVVTGIAQLPEMKDIPKRSASTDSLS